ncbi:hypothetical protein IAG44_18655 [Streptomyces roseirectus]|uniref:Uncharacterized protein n=1 Tax=Streptomyces roseirectus TaxID=2768066 RepID=A0A7H0IEP6_9ACTN|nr:hypothetical protein [Streptomyces roseirectus]QNP71262.1 hypothetical protein IAG44_18655 [Streptomyces roseirectus]
MGPVHAAWTTIRTSLAAEIHGGPVGLFATEPDGEHALTRWEPETGGGLSSTDRRVYRWNGSGGVDDWTPLGEATFDGVLAGDAGLFATRGDRLLAYDEASGRWHDTGETADRPRHSRPRGEPVVPVVPATRSEATLSDSDHSAPRYSATENPGYPQTD